MSYCRKYDAVCSNVVRMDLTKCCLASCDKYQSIYKNNTMFILLKYFFTNVILFYMKILLNYV